PRIRPQPRGAPPAPARRAPQSGVPASLCHLIAWRPARAILRRLQRGATRGLASAGGGWCERTSPGEWPGKCEAKDLLADEMFEETMDGSERGRRQERRGNRAAAAKQSRTERGANAPGMLLRERLRAQQTVDASLQAAPAGGEGSNQRRIRVHAHAGHAHQRGSQRNSAGRVPAGGLVVRSPFRRFLPTALERGETPGKGREAGREQHQQPFEVVAREAMRLLVAQSRIQL